MLIVKAYGIIPLPFGSCIQMLVPQGIGLYHTAWMPYYHWSWSEEDAVQSSSYTERIITCSKDGSGVAGSHTTNERVW